MTAIINGLMTLEYEQVVRTNAGESILESELMIISPCLLLCELSLTTVVWRLPPGNGPGGVDPTYQDPNPPDSQTNPDLYVVFHFHTEHIATVAGAQRPGIYAIVAFHGQGYGTGSVPRVDGNNQDGRSRRARVMNCNTGGESTPHTIFFYPGELTNGEAASLPPWAQIMTEFGNYLVAQGLLTAATFTGQRQGQLQLISADPCTRQYFNWGTYDRSRQFGPNGAPPPRGTGGNPPPTGGDNEQDNDGV